MPTPPPPRTIDQLYAEENGNATFTIGHDAIDGQLSVTSHYKDDQGGTRTWGGFFYDGDTLTLRIGDRVLQKPGKVVVGSLGDEQCVLLDANNCLLRLGDRNAGDGRITLRTHSGTDMVSLSAETGTLTLGSSAAGARDAVKGRIFVQNANSATTMVIDGGNASLTLGGNATNGTVRILAADGTETAKLEAAGNLTLGGNGQDGDIHIMNAVGNETIRISGSTGDIEFFNADVAEEFEVAPDARAETAAGTVMVLDAAGRIVPCEDAYDGKVVGIVAGAGSCRPGIVLGKVGGEGRLPIAMLGKVYCRVEADSHPVAVGDLLTTSARKGHAMRATDRLRAFGTVIGKALAPLETGSGLIPVLVKQQ